MKSGTPTAVAPGDFSSAGRITSHNAAVVWCCFAVSVSGHKSPGREYSSRFGSRPEPEAGAGPKLGRVRVEIVALAASIHLMASRRSIRRGSLMSDVSFLHFRRQIIAGAPRVGHDGQRRILVGVGDKRPAIGDEQVFHLPGLAV